MCSAPAEASQRPSGDTAKARIWSPSYFQRRISCPDSKSLIRITLEPFSRKEGLAVNSVLPSAGTFGWLDLHLQGAKDEIIFMPAILTGRISPENVSSRSIRRLRLIKSSWLEENASLVSA